MPGRLVHVVLAVFGIGAIASGPGAVAVNVMVTLPPASIRAIVAPSVVPLRGVDDAAWRRSEVMLRRPTLVNAAGNASLTTTSNAGAAPAALVIVRVYMVVPPVLSNADGLTDLVARDHRFRDRERRASPVSGSAFATARSSTTRWRRW